MATAPTGPNPRRSSAARANGSKGGVATTKNHSPEWLSQRGKMGGATTRDLYSVDFFRHAQAQRKIRRGWPQGKLRKAVDKTLQVIHNAGLQPENEAALLALLGSRE